MKNEVVRKAAYFLDIWTYYTVMIVGTIMTALLLLVFILIGYANVEKAINYPPVYSGEIIAFSYDGGHETSCSYTIGNWSITHKTPEHEEAFYIAVSNGKNTDYWEVTRDQYCDLEIGAYVTRKELAVK